MGTHSRGFRQEKRDEKTSVAALSRHAQSLASRSVWPASRLAVLAVLVTAAAQKGHCHLSTLAIAARANCSERTVRNCLRELEAANAITTTHRAYTRNRYSVHIEQQARTAAKSELEKRALDACRVARPRSCGFDGCRRAHRRAQRTAQTCAPVPRCFRFERCDGGPAPLAYLPSPRSRLRARPVGFPTVRSLDPTTDASTLLRPGDVLLEVAGSHPEQEPSITSDWVSVFLWRNGATVHALVQPTWDENRKKYRLGVRLYAAKLAAKDPPGDEELSKSSSSPPAYAQNPKPLQGREEQNPSQPRPEREQKNREKTVLDTRKTEKTGLTATCDTPTRQPPRKTCGDRNQANAQNEQNEQRKQTETPEERETRVVSRCRTDWEPFFLRETPERIGELLRVRARKLRERLQRPDLSSEQLEDARVELDWVLLEITERESDKSSVVQHKPGGIVTPHSVTGLDFEPIPEGPRPQFLGRLLQAVGSESDHSSRSRESDGVLNRPELGSAGSSCNGTVSKLCDRERISWQKRHVRSDHVSSHDEANVNPFASLRQWRRLRSEPLDRQRNGTRFYRGDSLHDGRKHNYTSVVAGIENGGALMYLDCFSPGYRARSGSTAQSDIRNRARSMEAPDARSERSGFAWLLTGLDTPEVNQTGRSFAFAHGVCPKAPIVTSCWSCSDCSPSSSGANHDVLSPFSAASCLAASSFCHPRRRV